MKGNVFPVVRSYPLPYSSWTVKSKTTTYLATGVVDGNNILYNKERLNLLLAANQKPQRSLQRNLHRSR